MPDTPTFVVNDRRKFTAEGELRPDAPHTDTPVSESAEDRKGPQLVSTEPTPGAAETELADLPESAAAAGPLAGDADNTPETLPDDALPPGPTDEQTAEATRAYDATVDRLDTAMRAANPGGERMPEMSFDRLVQSLYTQALILLGGGAQPGETPRVDILGARETIDMLSVIAEKTRGNLQPNEDKLLQSALFDLRVGFLEITQALARQAAQQRQGAPGSVPGAAPGGPRIVR